MFKKAYKWAIILGITAQVLFTLSWVVFGFLQGSSYSWLVHSISDMYAVGAPHGDLLVAILTLCGAMTILFVIFGLWPSVKNYGFSAKLSSVFIGLSIYGLGDLLSPFERLGCRLADRGCTVDLQLANLGGRTDQLLSTLGVLLFISGVITISYTVQKIKIAGPLPKIFMIAAYLMIPIVMVMGFVPGLGGLFERIIALIGASLLVVLAIICNKKPVH